MSLRNGRGTLHRSQARNFIQEEAQARLDEIVKPAQQQGLNALGVDSFEVHYYKTCRSTQLCSCKSFKLPTQLVTQDVPSPILDVPKDVRPQEITLDFARPLFGSATMGAVRDESDDSDPGSNDGLDLDEDTVSSKPLFSSSANCGICYKTGFVPSYELYGHQRQVLTTFDVQNVYGYNTDTSKAPVVLNQLDEDDGFVEFLVDVPWGFRTVKVSVRNNTEHLPGEPLYSVSGDALRLSNFQAAAGGQLTVRCRATQFTHVVIEFNLGHTMKANLAQRSKESDWSKFNTLSNIQFILPMTVDEVSTSDVLYVPARRMSFKVSEIQFLETAKGHNMDWSAGTRALQPQEALAYIHVGDYVGG